MISMTPNGTVWLIAILVSSFPALSAETTIRTCSFGASGDGCIFDLESTGKGKLEVDTKASKAGQHWRTTIVESKKKNVKTNVGTGSTSKFTGKARRSVKKGKFYETIVTYELPLPGKFPTSVMVRFDGPVDINGPRPTSKGGPEEPQSCKQISETAQRSAAVDEEVVGCGALVACRIDSSVDTDKFTFSAKKGEVISLNIAGTEWSRWRLFDPDGKYITGEFGLRETPPLPANGNYTIQTDNSQGNIGDYVISLQGVSDSAFNCGTPINNMKSGTSDEIADLDAFTFQAKTGQVYNIKIAGTEWSRWRLFGPDGKYITGEFGLRETPPLPANGRYTIEVENSQNRKGDYKLSLQRVGGS